MSRFPPCEKAFKAVLEHKDYSYPISMVIKHLAIDR